MILIIYLLWSYNYYKPGENDSFNLKVGEEFSVKLYENPSTGYSNCVLNENSVGCIEKVKQYYEPDWNPFKQDGKGGELILKFKAVKTGIDTIRISKCPTGREHKTCKDYSVNSSQIDNEFYVLVE